jgi:hypothetical protein
VGAKAVVVAIIIIIIAAVAAMIVGRRASLIIATIPSNFRPEEVVHFTLHSFVDNNKNKNLQC